MQKIFKPLKKMIAVSVCAVMVFAGAAAAGAVSGESNNISITANAADSLKSGNYEYSLRDDGTVMLTKYTGSEEKVVIPSEIDGKAVTVIGDYAFFKNQTMRSVRIPDGVYILGYACFSACPQLKEAYIPESVMNIDLFVFDRSRKGNMALEKIIGKKGSAAETFANEYGLAFVSDPEQGVEVEAVTIDKTNISIGCDESYDLHASVYPIDASDRKIIWSSSNPTVVSVTDGKIIGLRNGTATITALSSNGKRASCNVTVKYMPLSVKMNNSAVSMGVGDTYQLSAVIPDGSASAARTYRSSNSNVVKMTKTNWTAGFTAVRKGTAYVTVRLYNGKEASCKITVKDSAGSVKMNQSAISVGLGENCTLGATVPNGTAAVSRTYSSSNNSVVKMTRTNWTAGFTGVRKGSAAVSVKLDNGASDSCMVYVKPEPASVAVSEKTMTMKVGDTGTLSCIIPSSTAAAVRTWRTSNSKVIKMTKTNWTAGFTAVGQGVAWVTVRLYNGKEASCKITVRSSVAKIYLSPSNQYGNLYSYGNTNECDQCNRIADAAKTALERCGFEVKKAPKLQDMMESINESNEWGADLHMPIHTNAGGGNGTVCMVFRADEASLKFAKPIYEEVQAITPGKVDYGIREYPELSELKYTNMLAVYTEVDFHDNYSIAKWIVEHTTEIGEALAKGVCRAYNVPYVPPKA